MAFFSNYLPQINMSDFFAKINTGTVASVLTSVSLGISSFGFIKAFAFQFDYSPVWFQGVTYTIASIIGLNTTYRIWNIVKNAAPQGLKLLTNKNERKMI
ncbi:MAG: hypothetical protein WC627_06930, partial [Legionella sp.]